MSADAIWFDVDSPEVPTQWSPELFYAVSKKIPLGKLKGFYGEAETSVVQTHTDLTVKHGSSTTLTLVDHIQGEGRTDTEDLEGHEVGIDTATMSVQINELAHAVRERGVMVNQRIPWKAMDKAKERLAEWNKTRLHVWVMTHLCGWTAAPVSYYAENGGQRIDGTKGKYTGYNTPVAPDTYSIWRPGEITADQSLTDSHKMRVEYIDELIARAKSRPGLGPLRPAVIGGQECYVLLLHPNQVRDLRNVAETWFATMQNALKGGGFDNPIFSGALGYWNGTLLVEDNYVAPGIHDSTGVGVADVRRAVLCGAQAAVKLNGMGHGNGSWTMTTEKFDYKRSMGAASSYVGGVKTTRFADRDGTARDYGKIVMSTYAAEPVWS